MKIATKEGLQQAFGESLGVEIWRLVDMIDSPTDVSQEAAQFFVDMDCEIAIDDPHLVLYAIAEKLRIHYKCEKPLVVDSMLVEGEEEEALFVEIGRQRDAQPSIAWLGHLGAYFIVEREDVQQ